MPMTEEQARERLEEAVADAIEAGMSAQAVRGSVEYVLDNAGLDPYA